MLSSLVTFTGEIADTKMVLLLHKEKNKKNLDKQTRAVCENVSGYHPFGNERLLICLSDQIIRLLSYLIKWTKLKWWIDSDLYMLSCVFAFAVLLFI